MNAIEDFMNLVTATFPTAIVEHDPPLRGDRDFVTIRNDDRCVFVEWRPGRGFGISLVTEPALDGGPDIVCESPVEAVFRVVAHLHVPHRVRDTSSSTAPRQVREAA